MTEQVPQENIGTLMMKELITQLAVMNKNAEINRDLMIEIRDLLAAKVKQDGELIDATDALTAELETLGLAFEIMRKEHGDKRPTWHDFLESYALAAKEIHGDDDGDDDNADEGDDDGDEPDHDPSRPSRRVIAE